MLQAWLSIGYIVLLAILVLAFIFCGGSWARQQWKKYHLFHYS